MKWKALAARRLAQSVAYQWSAIRRPSTSLRPLCRRSVSSFRARPAAGRRAGPARLLCSPRSARSGRLCRTWPGPLRPPAAASASPAPPTSCPGAWGEVSLRRRWKMRFCPNYFALLQQAYFAKPISKCLGLLKIDFSFFLELLQFFMWQWLNAWRPQNMAALVSQVWKIIWRQFQALLE